MVSNGTRGDGFPSLRLTEVSPRFISTALSRKRAKRRSSSKQTKKQDVYVSQVLFVHKYSGAMILASAIPISLSYFLSTVTSIYSQYLSQQLPEPEADLKPVGVVLFLIGIAGNFYHHYLLSNLRGKEDRGYKVPKGGLFSLVICPHYLFEVVGFVGVSCFSQTLYTFCFTLGSFFYLLGRSHATRKWYIARFPNFPKQIKSIIPYVF
ncbi:uncharacterized protein [Aristolochia californica]|uniref:uncharacterized protein n=1 Tax=Aristolochia californica TaxID=171875 RepID=UPI0035DD41A8